MLKGRGSRKARQKTASKNISEFHKGGRYKKMVSKLGVKKANKIAVAAGLSAAGISRKKKRGKK